jgi:uncharacterized protein YdeI (BOF family)
MALILAVLAAGCARPDAAIRGAAPEGAPRLIAAAKSAALETPVTIQGQMIEKCPVAGCWFILRDKTGTIKVDTKTAGFVVLDVPLQTRMTVGGRVVREGDGSTRMIEAAGLRY